MFPTNYTAIAFVSEVSNQAARSRPPKIFQVSCSFVLTLLVSGGRSAVLVPEDALAEVSDHKGKSLAQGDLRLPAKKLLGAADVRLALVRVILGVLTELNPCIRVNGVLDNLGELKHGELARVSKVEWTNVIPFHQLHQTLNQIRNILEAPGLLAITVNSQGLLPKCLSNKVADNTAIINAHARAICVEDTCNPNLKVGTTVVVHGQRFSCTLALIVTAPDTDGIDIAPVSLHLGVLEGITIDLAGAGEEEPGVDPLCQSKHVQSPNHIGLVPSQRLRLTA